MATYLEEAVFRAVDEASRPISVINRALRELSQTQERFGRRDMLEGMTRGLSRAKTNVESLVREYERLGRAAREAGHAMGSARPGRGSRDAILNGREPRTGEATERAMHRLRMADIASEERERIASMRRIQAGSERTERAMQGQTLAALREKERAEQTAARQAERDAEKAARDQERAAEKAARIAERDAAAEAKRTIINQRRDDAAQQKASAKAERIQRQDDERERRSRFRFSWGRQSGEHGFHAHLAHSGVGVGGLSLPGAMALQGGTNAGMSGVHLGAETITEFSNQKFMLQAEGFAKEIPRIEAMASRVSAAVPEISKAEALSMFREQYGVTFNVDSAIQQTEAGAKRASVLKSAAPNVKEPTLPLAKAAENFLGSRLLTKAGQDFSQRLQDEWAKTLIAEKGLLQANDIKQMMMQSKGALRAKYDLDTAAGQKKALEEVGREFPVIGAELGGASTGTMLNSMSRAFNGRMTNSAKREFEDIGLLDEGKILSRDKKGNPDRLGYGAFKGSDKSMLEYTVETLVPALKKAHMYDDADKRNFMIDKLTSNQKVAGGVKVMAADFERLHEGWEASKRMASVPEIYKYSQKGDIGASARGAKGSLETLTSTYLEPLIPAITGTFTSLSAALQKASQSGEKNTPTKLAVGAGGAALAGVGLLGKAIYENPGQSANTTALGLETRAVAANTVAIAANTAAQGGKGLGNISGAPGEKQPGGGFSNVAKAAGTIGLFYAGMDALRNQFPAASPMTYIEPQLMELDAWAKRTGWQDDGPFRLRQLPKPYLRETSDLPGIDDYRPTGRRALSERLRRPTAADLGTGPFGALPDRKAFASDGSTKATAASLAGTIQPIASSITKGISAFGATVDGLPAKGASFGEQVGGALAGVAGSIGSQIGASFAAVASGIHIGVDTPRAAPNTGSPPAPE